MWKTLAAALLLVAVGPTAAQAQPPRTGLCTGLTGDQLTRCLYSDTDDRLRALGSVPTTPPTSPPPTSPPPTSPPPASGDWLSGAAGPEAANGTFGVWRGSKVEIGQTWANDAAMYAFIPPTTGCPECGEWQNFAGPMSISASPPSWSGWAAEASGVHDAYWTAFARKAKEVRGGKGQTYLNPYYEFNGDWMQWSVVRTTQGQADFRAGYARTAAILRKEFPGVKVVINPGAGRTVPDAMWPALSSFDVVGIDTYNEWPFCGDASCTGTQLSRVEVLRLQAAARGKPIAFPEWGNSAVASSGGGGGESPAFIDAFHGYLAKHAGTGAGEMVYETYFNIGGYPARYEFTPTNVQPKTAAAYQAAF